MAPGRSPLRFSARYRVRFDEADATGALRASAHLRYMQDVAWRHSTASGFDLAWYASQRRFWLVRYVELLLTPLTHGSDVEVSTEVTVMQRAWARRVSAFRLPDGQPAATAQIDWIMTNEKGEVARIPEALAAAFSIPAQGASPGRVALPEPPAELAPTGSDPAAARAVGAAASTSVARRSEIDPMGHMNNAAYIDRLEEAIDAAGGADLLDSRPRRYRVEFLLPAGPRERLAGRAWEIPDGWAYRLAGETGAVLFRGAVDLPEGARSGT